ncbi:MAG TPA: GDSL-type esterase/lipase family protein [Patescibacteria group bacterium]|nr:GDSL-type esterase/lipase family protein [Patescibacteria group bacterium]
MRVLIFGDSITQGFWDTDGGWVERLRQHYDALQIADLDGPDQPKIFNLGISADNSAGILKRIEAETKARTSHNDLPIVIIQVGTNDSSSGSLPAEKTVSMPIDQYQQNLHLIIKKVRPLSSKIILVGSPACDESRTTPAPWGEFYYTNQAIKSYEDVMKGIAIELNIPFVPVFAKFQAELNTGKNLLLDGLHPNNDGHKLLLDIIKPELLRLLAE